MDSDSWRSHRTSIPTSLSPPPPDSRVPAKILRVQVEDAGPGDGGWCGVLQGGDLKQQPHRGGQRDPLVGGQGQHLQGRAASWASARSARWRPGSAPAGESGIVGVSAIRSLEARVSTCRGAASWASARSARWRPGSAPAGER